MRKRKTKLTDYIPIAIVTSMLVVLIMAIVIGKHVASVASESREESYEQEEVLPESEEIPMTEDTEDLIVPEEETEAPREEEDFSEDFTSSTMAPFVSSTEATEKKKVYLTEEDFFNSLRKVARTIQKKHLKYNRNGGRKTLKGTKGFNCATYVSYALQDLGVIPMGKVMWFNDKCHGGAYKYIEKHPNHFDVYHPNKATINCKNILKPGDICGFKINGWAAHTAVYAGTDQKGHMLWYSGGGGDYKKVQKNGFQPVRFKYYEQKNDTLYTIVRIKYNKFEKTKKSGK